MNKQPKRKTATAVKATGPSIRFPDGDRPTDRIIETSESGEPARARAEQVFLSPRVIDSGSFDELTGELRGLIIQSSTLIDSLGTQTREARHVADQMNEAAARHHERLNTGARLLKTLQEQINRLEETAQVVGRRLDHLQDYESHAEDRLNDFKRRLDAAYSEALHALTQREAEIGAALTQLQEDIQSRAERLDVETGNLEDRLANIHTETAGITRPVSEHLESLLEQAHRVIGRETDDNGQIADAAPGTLHHLLASTREIQEKADSAAHQAAVIREQCEEVRQALDEERVRSAETLDQITRRHDNLRLAVNDAAGLCETAETRLRERITRLEDEITKALAKYDHEVSSRSEALQEAHRDADDTLHRMNSAQGELEQLVQFQEKSSERVRLLLNRLAPWEAILDSTDESDLPTPLRRMVETVQAEISRELTRLGQTLAAMAEHAERLAEDPDMSPTVGKPGPQVTADSLRIGAGSSHTTPARPAISGPASQPEAFETGDSGKSPRESIITTRSTRAAMAQTPKLEA